MIRILMAVSALMLLVSCGGQEGYKTPLVYAGDIQVKENCSAAAGGLLNEETKISVGEKIITVEHKNIYLPKHSFIGIEDVNGSISFEETDPYYNLAADDQLINLTERISRVNNETWCYYDLTVRISNVSGGEYEFYLWNEDSELIYQDSLEMQ